MVRILVPRETRVALQALADADGRTLAGLCRLILKEVFVGRLILDRSTLPDAIRSERIYFRCSRAFKAEVRRKAAVAGVTPSTYCHRILTRYALAPNHERLPGHREPATVPVFAR